MTYYDEIARGYNELYGDEQLVKAREILTRINPKSNELLLDVGCGSAPYATLFPCTFIGIDPSIQLIKKANHGIYIQAEAGHLPFRDACFDYVISITALHHVKDAEKALAEISRVANQTVVISLLKQSKTFTHLSSLLKKYFAVKSVIEQAKDTIFILEKHTKNSNI